jgi:hypothetical protein
MNLAANNFCGGRRCGCGCEWTFFQAQHSVQNSTKGPVGNEIDRGVLLQRYQTMFLSFGGDIGGKVAWPSFFFVFF